jgi:hypothetical protein
MIDPATVEARRDPRRSLIIGSVIAAVILAVMALVVLVGAYLVFEPRSTDPQSSGQAVMAASAPRPPIHRGGLVDS